jgi:uncharacterized membrane protein
MDYALLKWVHVLSSTVLFGAGVGSAFHLFASTLRRQVAHAPVPARYDRLFHWWVGLGLLAFLAFLLVFWLMVAKRVPWAVTSAA